MLPSDILIVSVDDHVIEHPRVWLDRLPKKFQEAGPRQERAADGGDWWIYEGKQAGNFALNAVVGKPYEDYGRNPRTYEDMRPGCYDMVERLKDMDIDGIHVQTCFPNMPGFAGRVFEESDDQELGLACVIAYNDWILDEWCAVAPNRQIPVVLVPYWDIAASVKEVERVAAKGARTFNFPEVPYLRGLPPYHTDHWDPLWAVTQDAGMVVSAHFGGAGISNILSPEGSRAGNMTNHISVMGLNCAFAMAELLTSPTFHKFPRLKFALSEGGVGWMPWMLERLDTVWERHRWYNEVNREIAPSELFKEHIFGCFISDESGIAARHRIGVDNIMFETDYPHSDGNWPHSRKHLEEALADVPEDESRKIAELNARRLFNFPRTAEDEAIAAQR